MNPPAIEAAMVFVAVILVARLGRHAHSVGASAKAQRRLGGERSTPQPGGSRLAAWTADAPERCERALTDAGFGGVEAGVVWRAWTLGGSMLVVLVTLVAGVPLGVVTLAVAVGAPPAVLWSLRDRGAALYEAMLPGLLDDVAAGLRSGSSLLGALGSAAQRAPGALRSDVGQVVESVGQGASFVEELDGWARVRPLASVQLAAAALAVGVSTGGRQAHSVETVSATLRERAAVRREAATLATQSRSSAAVMAVIPLVFAVAAAMLDPGVGHVLLHTPLGLGCLIGGVGLDAAAGLWMARITRGAS